MAIKNGDVIEFPCGSFATVTQIGKAGVELEYCRQAITVRFESISAIRKLLTRIKAVAPKG